MYHRWGLSNKLGEAPKPFLRMSSILIYLLKIVITLIENLIDIIVTPKTYISLQTVSS